jgi:hypothetical protein
MAGEHSETQAHESNGVSNSHAAARAAFISGEIVDGEDKKAPAANKDADDDQDDDLDEDTDLDEVDADADGDADADEEPNEDEDLDADEDADKDDDKDVDAETAKRLSQVRRTDKRLRERREQDFAKREAELEARETDIAEQLKPHIEKLEKFEKAASRVAIDPAGVLIALGLPEDRYEHAAQVLYTLAKGKDDPKARAAAAQLIKDRERDEKLEQLTKKDQEREEREREREKTAVADRQLDAYFGKVTKAMSDKTPLAKAYVKANPAESRDRMQVLAFRIAKETGSLPKERDVVIALEKDRRRVLRELGIDPKSARAAAASAEITEKKKPATKPGEKPKKRETETQASDKPLTKAEFVRASRDNKLDD